MKIWIFFIVLAPIYVFSQYAIATGDRDRERLHILNDLYNSSSLSLLELEPGLKVLTVGCGVGLLEVDIAKKIGPVGRVLGTDKSGEQLKIAEQNGKGLENLQFSQIDIEDTWQLTEKFDRIHCRFVLSHYPIEKGERVIPILFELLAPGGLLVLEEIATLGSLYCEPPHAGYDRWVEVFEKQFAVQHSVYSPGERIADFLQNQGFSFSARSHQPVLKNHREKTQLLLGVRSLQERLISAGAYTSAEIEEIASLLEQLERDPSAFPRYCEAKQIVIRRI